MAATALSRSLTSMVNPAVFDFWAAHINPLWSWQRPLARVVARYPESANAVTLVLKANRHFQGFQPGQHIHVSAAVNGHRVTRSYSLTNVPSATNELHITVREVAGGRLSRHLCRHTAVGDVLDISQAFGELALPTDSPPLFLMAAGSGITPMMGLLRARDRELQRTETTLFYWASQREQFCFLQELRERAVNPDQKLRVVFALTQQTASQPDEYEGRLTDDFIRPWLAVHKPVHIRSCGPSGFVETVKAVTADKAASFQAEAFTPLAIPPTAQGNVELWLARSQRRVRVPVGETLLNALEAQGIQPEYGCRMGICNTCACRKIEGTTQNIQSGECDSEATDALRLCISRATTHLTLDL